MLSMRKQGKQGGQIMAFVRWDPFHEFTHLQNRLNHVFNDAYGRAPVGPAGDEGLMASGAWVPAVDIYENGQHELVLKAELPDVSREVKEDQFQRIERRYGTFSRSFSLPPKVDAGKVSAEYKNGVLTVRLPLREEAKPRQIKVDVAAA